MRRCFTDGPFVESKEYLAGFWIIEAPDLDVAEEAAAEAFAGAVRRWPADGVPPNPGAWPTTTANRKTIDRIRRENKRGGKQREAQMLLLYDDPGRSQKSRAAYDKAIELAGNTAAIAYLTRRRDQLA